MRRLVTVIVIVVVALLTIAAISPSQVEKSKDYKVVSTELQLPSRGTTIPATVVMPVGKPNEKFPLVVIHHGHGGGRNENGGLTRVADALAKAGIMSIRMDFPGAGDSKEPFTKLTYTNMLADSNAALLYAVRNLPVDKDRIGGFGYSEGSAVVAMQAGQPFTPYKAVALLGPVAHPARCSSYSWERISSGPIMTKPKPMATPKLSRYGQHQNTSLEWFDETLAANPVGDIEYFKGRVLILRGDKDTVIPQSEADAYMAATKDAAKSNQFVLIPNADHGYGFYSDQPDVDALLHKSLVDFFRSAEGSSGAIDATSQWRPPRAGSLVRRVAWPRPGEIGHVFEYLDLLDRSVAGEPMSPDDWDLTLARGRPPAGRGNTGSVTGTVTGSSTTTRARASAVFDAGLELAVEVGVYNLSTGRRVRFTPDELQDGLRERPECARDGRGRRRPYPRGTRDLRRTAAAGLGRHARDAHSRAPVPADGDLVRAGAPGRPAHLRDHHARRRAGRRSGLAARDRRHAP